MKMLDMRINNYLNKGFTKEELQPLYNLYDDYSDLRNEVWLKD